MTDKRLAKALLERPFVRASWDVLRFIVYGLPEPKGSTKIIPLRRTFPFTAESYQALLSAVAITSDNPDVKQWERAIGKSALAAMMALPAASRGAHMGALALQAEFFLPRPQRVTADEAHVVKPDLDKLLRSCLDALTGIAWLDDAQVTSIVTGKAYASAAEPSRVSIIVRPVEPPLFGGPGA